MRVENIKDIDILRQAARLLEKENDRLVQEVLRLKQRMMELEGGDPEQLKLKLQELEQQLAIRNKKLFGDSSEKRPGDKGKGNGDKKAQTGHGPRQQPELLEIPVVHELDKPDEICPHCGGHLTEWPGQFEESEEIDVIERQFIITKHKRKKYRCKCGQCIETAPGPKKLIEGGRYSTEFALSVAIAKYADHLPLERLVKIMQRQGLIIDSQTLWNQIEALATLLGVAHERLQQYILSRAVIGADETFWRLMGELGKNKGGHGKRWHAWSIVGPDAVYYRILNSRGVEAAEQVLKDYEGTVICDGYSVYVALKKKGKKFRLAHCWAHVRRKFVEIEHIYPDQCKEVLDLIGQLYEIERECIPGVAGDELRYKARQQRSGPIVEKIYRWALQTQTLPESALGKAIAYMGSMWEGLKLFLDDPAISLDNNFTERAIRGVVLGRKNHYGSRSQRGTEVAALFYSLIESAKLVGLDPHVYLRRATQAALDGETIPLPHELM
jgi:transposase